MAGFGPPFLKWTRGGAMEYTITGSVPSVAPSNILRIDLPGLRCDLVSLGKDFDDAIKFFYEEHVRGYLAGDRFEKLMLQAFDAPDLTQTMVDTHFANFTPLWNFFVQDI